MEVRKLDNIEPRIETGVTQFGSDWPGVFIRGDNAFAFKQSLQRVLKLALQEVEFRTTDSVHTDMMQDLVDLLDDSNIAKRKDGGVV